MRILSSQDTLEVWEKGRYLHPLDRALAVLEFACPEMNLERLRTMPIGQRDMLLVGLYERNFGKGLKAFTDCPECRERLEFTVNTGDILQKKDFNSYKEEYLIELADEGMEFRFRLPDSYDLAEVSKCRDLEDARSLLVQRCSVTVEHNGTPVTLSEDVINRIEECMAECDPQGDMLIDLICPACSSLKQIVLDIYEFIWDKIVERAGRLLQEVHIIASAYKWHEADILSMSSLRRQRYLDMVI